MQLDAAYQLVFSLRSDKPEACRRYREVEHFPHGVSQVTCTVHTEKDKHIWGHQIIAAIKIKGCVPVHHASTAMWTFQASLLC